MLNVIPVEIDHDWPEREKRFREFAETIIASGGFDSEPIIEHIPVFSYSRAGRNHLDALVDRIGIQPAIIYLSDICSYSFVLVQTARELGFEYSKFPTYDSFLSLQNNPVLEAYAADENIRLRDSDCLIISLLPYGLIDVETDKPNLAVIDIVQELETDLGVIYCYRIREREKYFKYCLSCDWPIYALNASDFDISTALNRYRNEELTEYLLSNQFAFGTLNDNHQDDFYAVSYRKSFWKVDDSLTHNGTILGEVVTNFIP